MLRATKTVRFDAAHILTNHQGLCKNLHGHTYRVDVTVEQQAGEPHDMVIDFKDLKHVCEEIVLNRFDHAFIYDESSPVEKEIAEVLEKNNMRTVALPFRSTAENLARHFYDLLAERMPSSSEIASVKVWETADSCAEYRRVP